MARSSILIKNKL